MPTSSRKNGEVFVQSIELQELQIDPKIQLIEIDPNKKDFSQITNPKTLYKSLSRFQLDIIDHKGSQFIAKKGDKYPEFGLKTELEFKFKLNLNSGGIHYP